MVTLLEADDLVTETAAETAVEQEPETSPATSTCLACDGGGRLCAECGNIPDQCACLGGCSALVDCGDCEGSGVKPAAPVVYQEEYAESPTNEMDLRDDEPVEQVEPAAEQPVAEAKQETPVTLSDRELFLKDLDRAELMVAEAELELRQAKTAHKEARELFDSRVAELRKLIRVNRKPMPLFDQVHDQVQEMPANPEGSNGTPKESPANPEGLPASPEDLPATNGKPDAWRPLNIDTLQAHGLSENIVAKLREKSLETLGDLADHQAKHGQWWFKEIKGLGEGKAAKVADAQAAFWAAHPEYCQ